MQSKSIIYDNLAKKFNYVEFQEIDTTLDFATDIDYVGIVGNKQFGIQLKTITNKSEICNYSPSDRMIASFNDFQEQFGGSVLIIYSIAGEIANIDIIKDIENEINRLKNA